MASADDVADSDRALLHKGVLALALFCSFTYLAGAVMTLAPGTILDTSTLRMGFVFAALIGMTAVPLFLNAGE